MKKLNRWNILKINKRKLFIAYNGFNIISDIGSSIVGRFKNYFPNFQQILLEFGALTVIFSHYNIRVPEYVVLGLLVCQQYFWMAVYYFSGVFFKKVGFIKAQNEFGMKHIEDFNPMQMEIAETLESLCEKVGAESKLFLYRELKQKKKEEDEKAKEKLSTD